MAQESSTLIFFQRAVAIALTVTTCRQLGTFYTPLSLILPSNLLTDAANSMIAVTIVTSTLFFTWHIAGPTTDSSTLSTTSLNFWRIILASIVLVLAVCGDSLFKRATLALAIGACWALGWGVTTAEQRESYWQYLKQGLILKLLDLCQKVNRWDLSSIQSSWQLVRRALFYWALLLLSIALQSGVTYHSAICQAVTIHIGLLLEEMEIVLNKNMYSTFGYSFVLITV